MLSAPSSPSAVLHYASRRKSSSANSPRFLPQVSGAASWAKPNTAPSAQSPVPAFAPSPQFRRREYKETGTQYTPPGYPPTYRPPPPPLETSIPIAPAALPETTIPDTQQGESSAEPVVTEPPEPALRIDPQPVAPSQNGRPARRTPREAPRQDEPPSGEGSAVAQEQLSPAKRARTQDPNLKVMPLKYETCDVKDLGVLISDMLMELVRLNDGIPLRDGQLTRFHSRYYCCFSD